MVGLLETILPRGYHYYDTPEGQDCAKKLWYVVKESCKYGLYASTIDVLMISHPKGLGATLGRYVYIMPPVIGMGATFVITTCMATNLRKKDDFWNYFFGGYAVGGIMGTWLKSLRVGIYGGAAFAAFMAVRKDLLDKNYDIFTIYHSNTPIYESFWFMKHDYTFLADPGREWKTSEDK